MRKRVGVEAGYDVDWSGEHEGVNLEVADGRVAGAGGGRGGQPGDVAALTSLGYRLALGLVQGHLVLGRVAFLHSATTWGGQ